MDKNIITETLKVCPHGHLMSADNAYVRKDGWLQCRQCRAQWSRARYARSHPERRLKEQWKVQASACWQWLGLLTQAGYGHFGNKTAHWWLWEIYHGPVPPGMEIHHRRQNKACCNPEHPIAVTRAQHAELHGYRIAVRNKAKTHCPQGHVYDQANTIIRRDRQGRQIRDCRACQRQRAQQYRARQKAKATTQRSGAKIKLVLAPN